MPGAITLKDRKIYSNEMVSAALEEADSDLDKAAEILGCTRQTIYYRLQGNQEMRERFGYDERERHSNRKYSFDQMISALSEARGNVTQASEIIGCSRSTIKSYIERYPEVRAAFFEENEKVTDLARIKLIEAIDDREPWAIMFYFKYIINIVRGNTTIPYAGEIAFLGSGSSEEGKTIDLSVLTDDELDTLAGIAKRLHGDQSGAGETQPA